LGTTESEYTKLVGIWKKSLPRNDQTIILVKKPNAEKLHILSRLKSYFYLSVKGKKFKVVKGFYHFWVGLKEKRSRPGS